MLRFGRQVALFSQGALAVYCQRLLLLITVLVLLALGFKAWLVYGRAQALYSDIRALDAAAAAGPSAGALAALGAQLDHARTDAQQLRAEAAPLLPIARRLGWLPWYGPDIAAAEPLLGLAVSGATAADELYAALAPLTLDQSRTQPLGVAITRQLGLARPRLEAARQAIADARQARAQIAADQLSAPLSAQLRRIDPLLAPAQDGVDLALALPDLIGAHGRRTYLLIAQNPDELRATGGLITAAGLLTFDGGQLASFSIGDSSAVNNFGAANYPDPPAPLRRFMGLEQWAFQDANWSPDFPTAARAAEKLYALGQRRDVDGVIAIDPSMAQLLLDALGPVTLDGSQVPITSANVVAYMRNALLFSGDQGQASAQPWWRRRKAFMEPLAQAIIHKLSASQPERGWPALAQAIARALDERHAQIALGDPAAAAVLNRRGWDGAVRPGPADFLMVVDSNMGYNKVTPNIQEQISYTLDLSDMAAPAAELSIQHTHRLKTPVACDQNQGADSIISIRRYEEMMAGCYWDYLRVLIPSGSRLIAGAAQPVPGQWLLTGDGYDGATTLGEGEAGARTLDAFLVVPPGDSRRTFFRYRVRATLLTRDAQGWHYHLQLQKQAGAAALPVTVTLRLPPQAQLVASSATPDAQDDGALTFGFKLDGDRALDVLFRLP